MDYVRSRLKQHFGEHPGKPLEIEPIEGVGTTIVIGKEITSGMVPWNKNVVVPVEKNRNVTFSATALLATTATISIKGRHKGTSVWTILGDLDMAAAVSAKLTLNENWDEFLISVVATNQTISSISLKTS